jgi:F0F1-type ATP synthase membrane subunit b/b'
LREAQKLLAEAEAQKRDLDQKLKNLENEKKELRLRLRSDVESAIKSAIAKAERLSRSAIEDANARSRQLIEDFKREMIAETGRRVVLRAESIIRQRITEQDSSRLREQLSKEIVGG